MKGSRIHTREGLPLGIQKSERMHYRKDGWIRAAGGTLTFEFLGILGPHFSTLMFTLWSFFLYLIYLHPIQGIAAEHSEGFKEENRSPLCGRIHSCGWERWWHALSYLRWVSSYKFHWKCGSEGFQPNLDNGSFILLATPSRGPCDCTCSRPVLFPTR